MFEVRAGVQVLRRRANNLKGGASVVARCVGTRRGGRGIAASEEAAGKGMARKHHALAIGMTGRR